MPNKGIFNKVRSLSGTFVKMKYQPKPILWVFLGLFSLSPLNAATVVVGDSIAEANSPRASQPTRGDQSWRLPFWKQSIDAGNPVEFIGTRNSNHNGDSVYSTYNGYVFPRSHEAIWGTNSAERQNTLASKYALLNPDRVILHIGSNDVFASSTEAQISAAAERQRNIINGFQAVNPTVSIYVVSVLPRLYSATVGDGRNPVYQQLNAKLTTIASQETDSNSTVKFINAYPFIDHTMFYDGIHFNESGEEWFGNFLYNETIPEPTTPIIILLGLGLFSRRRSRN